MIIASCTAMWDWYGSSPKYKTSDIPAVLVKPVYVYVHSQHHQIGSSIIHFKSGSRRPSAARQAAGSFTSLRATSRPLEDLSEGHVNSAGNPKACLSKCQCQT